MASVHGWCMASVHCAVWVGGGVAYLLGPVMSFMVGCYMKWISFLCFGIFYNQKNNSLHLSLKDSIDRHSQSRGILSLIEWSRLTREFIPTLVLLLLLVLKVV